MKKGDWRYYTIISLSALALIFSIMLFLLSNDNSTVSGICTAIDASNPCKAVQESGYAYLFGVHNSVLGIVGFSLLMMLSVYQLKKRDFYSRAIIILGSFIAAFGAIVFLLLQTFVIKKYCVFCIVVDAVSIALLVIAIQLLKIELKKRK